MSDKTTILFVDDEERILRTLKMLFRSDYNVLTSDNGNEALDILRTKKVHVIVSDQRMPVMQGAELLRQAKEVSPNTMRLLLTGYSDLESIIGSINEGEVFRFINKPWKNQEIKEKVSEAVDIALSLDSEATEDEAKANKPVDISQAGLLVLDEDPDTYKTINDIAAGKINTAWAQSIDDAFAKLSEENIAVVVSEIKIGGEDVTAPLKELKSQYPEIVTIVLTSFQDTHSLIDLINQGQIYRFLPKPILRGLLAKSIESAFLHYRSIKNRPQILKRYKVEKRAEDKPESKVSSKIMGYLKKIRERM